MTSSRCLEIHDSTQVGEGRRAISALATDLGLSETLRGQAAIVATELGNNLIKHAGGQGGVLVFRGLEQRGIEILSLDQGPGMEDVARCMADGYSTAGSPGTGLGAVSRLSTVFDIYSQRGQGTAVLSQVTDGPRAAFEPLEVGAICLPLRGETVSGDALEVRLGPELSRVLVADGLGHGSRAHEASSEAGQSFRANPNLSSAQAIEAIHLALRSTRGAAVAVAEIDFSASAVHYAGIGNITGVVFSASGEQRRMVSHNGTAGVHFKRAQAFDYPWGEGSVLVMHSDGLTSHWGLDKYPGLLKRHPAIIAGVLYRDFNRGRDDSSIIVVAGKTGLLSWKGAA